MAENASFDHDTTSFQLMGEHQNVACEQCHTSLVFDDAPSQCANCHTDIHANTVGQDCDQCHNNSSWIISNIIDLHRKTRFPLVGAHALADCYDCHKSVAMLQFEPMGVNCYDCHQNDYLATTTPNHLVAGFSTECSECHRMETTQWKSDGFDHSFFPLIQGHANTECTECHTQNNYSSLSSDCFSCHAEDYNATQNPSHIQNAFSQNCQECHSLARGWSPVTYRQHDAISFPIYSGEHKGEWSNCNECHTVAGDYTQFKCTNCHEHNRSSMDSEHRGVDGYAYNDQLCYACHPRGSENGAFNHNLTHFPLTGMHRTVSCEECHTQGYAGTSTECRSCHTEDYTQTSSPNHITAGFSTDCAMCHSAQGWSPSSFNHDSYYPLLGAHATIKDDCQMCHAQGYENTPNTCYACHNTDYTQTTNPSHASLGFSTDCESCHSLNAWSPANFNHDEYWVLRGAHASIANDCQQCHAAGYANTSSACYSCHSSDYTSASNPNHATAGFPTDCEECHGVSVWDPSTFNHDSQYFPIYSGTHRGEWSKCSECHTNTSSFSSFTCTNCHEHSKNNMDSEHDDVRNYVYNSANCFACHPRGDD
ncbi:MAG: hypothetical protein PF444_04300 [Bacteroidales bacterium]|nr:hypothetical protein [Bacteroidales bacterium]